MRILGHLGKALSLAAFLATVCSAQGPSFTAAGIRNAASGGTALAPHARAQIVGSNLGPLQIVSAQTPAGE
ncbi:MAG: hypothetical protein KDC27_15270, partial [Acidobacteria bacterium]|nr:hypothetical protein [Acidobacteriota bacterium]